MLASLMISGFSVISVPFSFSFLLIGLVLFFVTILAETSRVPFDTPEAEGEIVAGFNTEYGSIYFSMFVLAEYGNAVAIAFLAIIYFQLPVVAIAVYVALYAMCRSVLPRVR